MKTRRYCPKCGRELLRSRVPGYTYECKSYDEDFYKTEVLNRSLTKNKKSAIQIQFIPNKLPEIAQAGPLKKSVTYNEVSG